MSFENPHFIAISNEFNFIDKYMFEFFLKCNILDVSEFILNQIENNNQFSFISFGPSSVINHSFYFGFSSVLSNLLTHFIDSSIDIFIQISNSNFIFPENNKVFLINSKNSFLNIFKKIENLPSEDLIQVSLFFGEKSIFLYSLPSFPSFKSSINLDFKINGWDFIRNINKYINTTCFICLNFDINLNLETFSLSLLTLNTNKLSIKLIEKPQEIIEFEESDILIEEQENLENTETNIKNENKKIKKIKKKKIKKIKKIKNQIEEEDNEFKSSFEESEFENINIEDNKNNSNETETDGNVSDSSIHEIEYSNTIETEIKEFVSNLKFTIPLLKDKSIFSTLHQQLIYEKWKGNHLSEIINLMTEYQNNSKQKRTIEIENLRQLVNSNDFSIFIQREETKLKLLEEKTLESINNLLLKKLDYYSNLPTIGLFNSFKTICNRHLDLQKNIRFIRSEIRKKTMELEFKQIKKLEKMEKHHKEVGELSNLHNLEKEIKLLDKKKIDLINEIESLEDDQNNLSEQKLKILNMLK